MGQGSSSSGEAAKAAAPPRQKQLASQTVQSTAQFDRRIEIQEKKRALQEARESQEWEKAKAARAAGNVAKAKMHLKLRAQAKKQIEQIDAHIDKMYTLRGSIESAQMNREMLEGMQSGTSALKATQVDVDHATDVMTDLSMELDTAQEVNDVLHGTSLPGQDEIDAEAEDELAAMEAEMAAEASSAAPAQAVAGSVANTRVATTGAATSASTAGAIGQAAAAAMPSAPVHSVTPSTPARDQVDDELAALEAEMA